MRFHFGISFRLRNLKKFIFPFLIGLLSYFGFSYFNLLSVFALDNFDSYYDYTYEELDFSSMTIRDTNIQDIIDSFNLTNDNYYLVPVYSKNNNINFLYFYLIDKSNIDITFSIDITNYSSTYEVDYSFINLSGNNYYSFLQTNSSLNQYNNFINNINNCINNNSCSSLSKFTNSNRISAFYFNGTINNNDNYSIVNNNQYTIIYNSSIPINYYSNSSFNKSLKIGDNLYSLNSIIPTYINYFNNDESSDESFDLYLSRLPYVYSNTSNLSNYNSTISFSISSDVESYKNNLYTYKFYYGRVDHGTYYTYEQLNCTSSSISNSSDTTITITTNNISCNNDLSKYDKYFVTYNFKYEDDSLSKSIYGFSSSINNGFILHNTLINYYLLDNFYNLPRGFSLLLSNNDTYNDLTTYFYSDNEYIAFDDISKNANNVVKTTNGVFYKDLAIPKKRNYGFTTNTNLLVYDDLSYSTKSDTTLYMYLNPLTMVSFVDTSNNTNSYTYYDSNNNITTSTIDLIYDTIDDNTYNIDSVFQDLNNYIYDIRKDMFSVHLIMTDIYSSIPSSIRYFFNFFFSLGLIFILYKEMRDS